MGGVAADSELALHRPLVRAKGRWRYCGRPRYRSLSRSSTGCSCELRSINSSYSGTELEQPMKVLLAVCLSFTWALAAAAQEPTIPRTREDSIRARATAH